jgi:putative transposase
MGLQCAATTRPTVDQPGDQRIGAAVGRGESALGGPQDSGELSRLGYSIVASTVWEILTRAGVDPAPRRTGPTWRQFLAAQVEEIIAADFLHVECAVTLKRFYVLIFIEHGTRRLHIAGVTAHPTGAWVAQQARNLAMEMDTGLDRLRFFLRDRDAKSGLSRVDL